MNKSKIRNICSVFLVIAVISSCKTDETAPPAIAGEDTTGTKAPETPKAPLSVKSLNWDAYPDQTYSNANAAADFGTITGWKEQRTIISGKTLRVKLEKNALSSAGGIVANINIDEGSEYEVEFKAKFHSQFDWSKGGKLGFGLRIGEGNTGCDKADDGNGGSARMMWYTSGNGDVKLKPYLYYKDMPDECGSGFNTAYPSNGSIEKGIWYTIKIYVKSNTGTNTDGRVKFSVDGNTVLDRAIRWTTNDSKRLINKLSFATFRGGSTPDWQSDTDGYIYFDDLKWTKLN